MLKKALCLLLVVLQLWVVSGVWAYGDDDVGHDDVTQEGSDDGDGDVPIPWVFVFYTWPNGGEAVYLEVGEDQVNHGVLAGQGFPGRFYMSVEELKESKALPDTKRTMFAQSVLTVNDIETVFPRAVAGAPAPDDFMPNQPSPGLPGPASEAFANGLIWGFAIGAFPALVVVALSLAGPVPPVLFTVALISLFGGIGVGLAAGIVAAVAKYYWNVDLLPDFFQVIESLPPPGAIAKALADFFFGTPGGSATPDDVGEVISGGGGGGLAGGAGGGPGLGGPEAFGEYGPGGYGDYLEEDRGGLHLDLGPEGAFSESGADW